MGIPQPLHCPKCGHDEFRDLFGGKCELACGRCGYACNCRDPFTDELQSETVPLKGFEDCEKIKKIKKEYESKKDGLQPAL